MTFESIEYTFWDHILWCNEAKIELFGHSHVMMIYWKKGEAFLPKNTSQQSSMDVVASCCRVPFNIKQKS